MPLSHSLIRCALSWHTAAPDPTPPSACEVLVCHAGACLARGAEAVLAEIEELASVVGGGCAVRASGCL